MSFTVPNLSDAAFIDQAEIDAVDVRIITDGSGLTGVVSGCAVTAQGSPDLTVAVAAGTIMSSGVLQSVTSGNVTIGAADGTNPRFDLIVADSSGAKQCRAGTAAANAVFPTPTAGDVVLAAVYIPAADTAINANQIVDKRVMVAHLVGQANSWAGVQTFTASNPSIVLNASIPSVSFKTTGAGTQEFKWASAYDSLTTFSLIDVTGGGFQLLRFQPDSGIASGETAIETLRYHNGTALTQSAVTLGVADSGGSGYKLLRVLN